MKRPALLLLVALSVAPYARADWDGRVWNDKRAEVAVYDAEVLSDGKPRTFRETLLINREDAGKNKVFKLNTVRQVEGANYPTSTVTTVIVDADNPERLLKIVMGAQDWGGNVFKTFAGGQLAWNAPDGEKTVTLDVQPGDLFEDALPLSLRGITFKEGLQSKARLWESLANNQSVEPRAVPIVISIVGEEAVNCRAGSLPSWKVAVEREGGATDFYWFEKKDPRLLVKMQRADASKRLLVGRARWSHWDKRLPRPNVLN